MIKLRNSSKLNEYNKKDGFSKRKVKTLKPIHQKEKLTDTDALFKALGTKSLSSIEIVDGYFDKSFGKHHAGFQFYIWLLELYKKSGAKEIGKNWAKRELTYSSKLKMAWQRTGAGSNAGELYVLKSNVQKFIDKWPGKNAWGIFKESKLEFGMIKLKNLFNENVDDNKLIKYKDKEGKPAEMKAKSAKTMEKDHPAKIAWDKENESSADGGEKPGADMFKSKETDKVDTQTDQKPKEKSSGPEKPIDFNEDEDVAYEYEDSITNSLAGSFGGDEEVSVAFDDFDMDGNPIYSVEVGGETKEMTVDSKTGDIHDYESEGTGGFGFKKDKDYAYGNVHEVRKTQSTKLKKILEGVKGYDVGPDLDDFDGMDFNGASSAIGWDEVYDNDDWKPVLRHILKYKSKLKRYGIKDKKALENFAKWMSSGFHKKS